MCMGKQTEWTSSDKSRNNFLSAWIGYCHATGHHLTCISEIVILSSQGCQQGDPFSSITFALNLQPVIDQINEEIPDLVLNKWFQDDRNLIGTVEQLTKAVDIILEEGPRRGLVLSTSLTTASVRMFNRAGEIISPWVRPRVGWKGSP